MITEWWQWGLWGYAVVACLSVWIFEPLVENAQKELPEPRRMPPQLGTALLALLWFPFLVYVLFVPEPRE